MRVPTVKDLMHGHCDFVKYEDHKLWYSVEWANGTFDFPIPTDDVGGGSFGLTEKAITLMRWWRKHIEYLNQAAATQCDDCGQAEGHAASCFYHGPY